MNRLELWDPFRDINRLTSVFSHPRRSELSESDEKAWAPAVDISEDDEAFTLVADLPDVKKEDIKVTVDNGFLTLSGERKFEKEEKDKKKKYHRIERSYGSYTRSFALPENVDASQFKAESKDGVLKVVLPKVESPEAVEVKVE